MKKINLLIIFILFALSGCNKTAKVDEQSVSEQQSRKAGEEQTKKADGEKETSSVSGLPHFLIEERTEGHLDESNGDYMYDIASARLYLKEEGKEFEALKRAIENYNDKLDEELPETYEIMNEYYENIKDEIYEPGNLTDRTKTYIVRADKDIVSIVNHNAHGYGGEKLAYTYTAYNFDTATGKELKFGDVVKDVSLFFDLADERAKDYSDDEFYLPSEYAQDMEEDYSDLVWTVSPEGVSIYFSNNFERESVEESSRIITVYFDEGEDIFEPKYINKEDEYVFPLLENMTIDLDINNDGNRVPVYIKESDEEIPEDVYVENVGFDIFVGDKITQTYGDGDKFYVIKKEGEYYIYAIWEDEGEYETLYITSLSDTTVEAEENYMYIGFIPKNLRFQEETWGDSYMVDRETFTDVNSFIAGTATYILSGIVVEKEWYVGKDGYPKTDDERYKIINNRILYTLEDIKVKKLDKEGNIKGDYTIPQNTYILYRYTSDYDSFDVEILNEEDVEVTPSAIDDSIDFYTLKGESPRDDSEVYYRITIDNISDMDPTINGVDVNELFKGLD